MAPSNIFDGSPLVSGMEKLFQEKKHTDLTIISSQESFARHKAIVCPQSKFFEAICDGQFQESQTNVINLLDDDPAAVKDMLVWMYSRRYTGPPMTDQKEIFPNGVDDEKEADPTTLDRSPSPEPQRPPTLDDLISMALEDQNSNGNQDTAIEEESDDYGFQGLFTEQYHENDQCSAEEEEIGDPFLTERLIQVLHTYNVADKYQIDALRDAVAEHFVLELDTSYYGTAQMAPDFMKDLFVVIRAVYELPLTDDRRLRDAIVNRVHQDIYRWLDGEDTGLMALAKSEAEFSADLMAFTVSQARRHCLDLKVALGHPPICEKCQSRRQVMPILSQYGLPIIDKQCTQRFCGYSSNCDGRHPSSTRCNLNAPSGWDVTWNVSGDTGDQHHANNNGWPQTDSD